jgi:hypothetical protein
MPNDEGMTNDEAKSEPNQEARTLKLLRTAQLSSIRLRASFVIHHLASVILAALCRLLIHGLRCGTEL